MTPQKTMKNRMPYGSCHFCQQASYHGYFKLMAFFVCESAGFFSFFFLFFFGVYLGERTQGRDGNKGLGDFSWKNGARTGYSMIKMSSDDYWYEDKM